MLERALKDIGLADKEVTVYLTALKVGSQPVSVLAKSSRLNRTTTYVILKKLLEKGLMSKYTKGGVQYFTPSSPENIKIYVEGRKRELDLAEESITNLMPDLEKIMQYSPKNTKVRFFEGIEGIKALYDYTLEVGARVDEYLFHYDANNPVMWDFWNLYIVRRTEKKIPMRLLAAEDETSIWAKKQDKKLLRETRIVPADRFPFGHNLIIIFGDYYGYISYAEGEYGGALIHDKHLADVERSMFEYIWETAEAFDKKIMKKYGIEE